MRPTAKAIFSFARSVGNQQLVTPHRKRPFRVSVNGESLEFTPGTSSKPRAENRAGVEALLSRHAKTGSSQPGRYADITFNASYVLALIQLWQTRA